MSATYSERDIKQDAIGVWMFMKWSLLFLLFILVSSGSRVLAHGSVTADGDLCLIRIGFYSAHFKIYQPQRSGHRDFCEDLPEAGEALFVMEYEHQTLGAAPIEFRIIRDATGLGRFAQEADVVALGDLAPHTVFHQAPKREPLVYSVRHEFEAEGDYLGIVTVQHPDTSQEYAAVFPFHVGARDWGLLPLFAVLALLAHGMYRITTGAWRPWRRQPGRSQRLALRTPLLLVLTLLSPANQAAEENSWLSRAGLFRVSYQSDEQPVPLNQIHAWILRLENADGSPLEDATITVDGGMPAHNHGLPTRPQVTARLGDGAYRVEGLRFHMQGDWELRLDITHADQRDSVVIPLRL